MSRAVRSFLFAGAMCVCAVPGLAQADDAAAAATEVDGLVVTGELARTSAVTGLDLTLRETPQSVTQITRERIDQFALSNVNTLLAQVPGVNVEQVETDRTYYNSRGFDITNFQVDGVGLPLIWGIQFGDLDTFLFERVEVVRGANSMMTGTGNPSATVNYIRKRPTRTLQGLAAVELGDWNHRRLEADLSGPLNAQGTLSGRVIYANEDAGSYLDYKSVNRNVYAALLAWDATPGLTVTGGYSLNDNRSKGNNWGALPLQYTDGARIDYPVSASTSADWTYWNVRDQTAFGEVDYRLAGGWDLKGVATYKRFEEDARLLYAWGNPDPVTGLGVFGMSGVYPSTYESWIGDLYASGPFRAFGRTHQAVIGGQVSRSKGTEYEDFALDTAIPFPSIFDWGRVQAAQPDYPGADLAAASTDRLYRAYAAAHLDITDRLKAVVGVNVLSLTTKGFSYGVDVGRDERAVSPYFGAVFDLTGHVSLYASYTDIYNPQSEADIDHRTLPAAHGKSYEAGLKSEWFDRRLYATAALFRSEQADLAEYAGSFDNGQSYYAGVDTEVTGFELEAVGALTDNWSLSAGWTDLSVEGADGSDIRLYLPRRTLKLMTTYTVPELRNLTVGAAVRWQDEVFGFDLAEVRQAPYALLDLTAGVDVTERVRATLNLRNATDEKHLNSIMWNQAFYGPPRSVFVRLDYRF